MEQNDPRTYTPLASHHLSLSDRPKSPVVLLLGIFAVLVVVFGGFVLFNTSQTAQGATSAPAILPSLTPTVTPTVVSQEEEQEINPFETTPAYQNPFEEEEEVALQDEVQYQNPFEQ